jgi:antitoxin component YwqK of YwqJK toxin-antitoxin module
MTESLEDRDGLLYYEGTDELAEGDFEHYSEEGPLYCQYSLKEGKYDGACIIYWSNGKVANKIVFEDGICNGEHIFYYRNGQVQSVEQIKNNVRHGICRRYSEDGKLVELIRCKDGKKID